MLPTNSWTIIDVPIIEALPEPIFSRSQHLLPRQIFPQHSHNWNQLVYATSGVLIVIVADCRYFITPEQAIWIPTGIQHTTGSLNSTTFRNLYIEETSSLSMPNECTVFSITPLLRELIIERETANQNNENNIYKDKLNELIFEQLKRLPIQNFHLPWPKTLLLHRICETLYANPADSRNIEDWGRELGTSPRTLSRHFEKEMGISLRKWRYRLRLFMAIEWLCSDRKVTEIALDLGYATTSAFTYMFHKEMGCTPSDWRTR